MLLSVAAIFIAIKLDFPTPNVITLPLFDRNAYAVTINFQVINHPEPVVVETLLERLR